MSGEALRWVIGAFASALVVGVGGLVSMMRVSFRMGELAHGMARLSDDVRAMRVAVERVPVHEAQIEALQHQLDRSSANGHAEE